VAGGYTGRIGFVNLTTNRIREERLDEAMARSYIGGYGLGVRILFENQKKGIDPLGPENILGFTTGPLTGTKTPTGARYMTVCKSPLTGGWADANSGGYFGSTLKSAGWDALFVSGAADSPKYLMVTEDGIELKDASELWGKDTIEVERTMENRFGASKVGVASIGPASEKLSLISGIVNDGGRVAGRAGVGAVMGSKKLKAVVVVKGSFRAEIADGRKFEQLRKDFLSHLRSAEGFIPVLMKYGTGGTTEANIAAGITPVKNWQLAGEQAMANIKDFADPDTFIRYQTRKYGCANCPVACGGIYRVEEGPYPVKEVHKPEYETIGAFGPMCLNNDLFSIIKLNDMCNRSGLDTISAGTVLAFAMECYEKGILSKTDTDGIELTWGNAPAMVKLLDKMIKREGIGDLLADGVKAAAKKIGQGAEDCAMHVGGQEPGLHNALFLPSRGVGFVCDPTPGRHTAGPMARLDTGTAIVAPYPELQFKDFEKYEYKKKGPASATISSYAQVGNCAGLCLFPTIFFGFFPMLDFLNAVTGWDMTVSEALNTGARIQTLRKCFNVREGIGPADVKLPLRMIGTPPKEEGPLKGVTIDIDNLTQEYHKAMGWDAETGVPTPETLKKLGLEDLVAEHG
jgi:aldehyde:ferredoxin oxidoreductase